MEMMDIKLVQTAELREISKLRLQTASLMQALLEARQQLQAANERGADLGRSIGQLEMLLDDAVERRQSAEQRARGAEAELEQARELIQKALDNELHCPWCFLDHKTSGHQPDCPAA